jgi:hypothetical protein
MSAIGQFPSPSGPPPSGKRPRRTLIVALIAVAALVVGVGGTVLVLSSTGAFSTEIVAEPVQTPGDNPFMPPVGSDAPSTAPPSGTGRTVTGDRAGLYGGTLNNSSCDPQKMITFLRSDPQKAAAWAAVQGIAVADIPRYVGGLTPVVLRSDVAVTNHGFTDGRATPRNSILQAGTAVLVDRSGTPRARCMCGNPLTPAQTFSRPHYEGSRWPSFSPGNITIIINSPVIVNQFIIINIVNYQIIHRPAGSRGEQDRTDVVPPPTEYTPPPGTVAPPAQPALAGEWTLRRTNTTCQNFPEGCSSGAVPVRFDDCTDTQCSISRTDGVWQAAHTISSQGSNSWRAEFDDIAITCEGQENVATVTIELELDSSGTSATGLYEVAAATNPGCESNARASYRVTGSRS